MALASSAFNRALADEPWARERLAAHAGRTFAVRVGPLTSDFRIGSDGVLEAARHDQSRDLIVTLSPLNVPAFLANPARWNCPSTLLVNTNAPCGMRAAQRLST